MKSLNKILFLAVLIIVIASIIHLVTPGTFAQVSTDPNFKVAFIGDAGNGSGATSVLNLIKSEGAQAVLHQGDFDYSFNATAFWGRIDSVLGSNFPYFVSVGNHDAASWNEGCGDPEGCYAKFQKDRLARIGVTPDNPDLNDQLYSATYKGLKMVFIGLAGNSAGASVYSPFIQNQLQSVNNIWRVCSWHKDQNTMQLGTKSDEMGWGVYEMCRQQGAIIATAHEHTYERTKTLTNIQGLTVDTTQHPVVGGVPGNQNSLLVAPGKSFVFVSGLGGNGPRNQDRCLPTTYPYGGGAGCNYIWASVYTTDQGGSSPFGALFITFNVDGNPSKARGYFKNVAGQTIDQFEIAASSTPITGQPTSTPTPGGATPTRTPTTGGPTSTITPIPTGGPYCTFWKGLGGGSGLTSVSPTLTNTPTPTGSLNPTPTPPLTTVSSGGIWISQQEISSLPLNEAWYGMKSFADSSTITPDVNNQDSNANVQVLARALVYARTGDNKYLGLVLEGLRNVIGTEGSNDLGLSRELGAYAISADIVNLKQKDAGLDGSFRAWLKKLLPTLKSVHERRPNNWGTNAGGSRLAAALYLGDQAEVAQAAKVFKGWLGERSSYSGFTWGDLSWQCNSNSPVGINPLGCSKQGRSIDGVLPDDQRRCGSFTWPPCATDYSWGGMMGAVVQAELLHRAGYDAWNWSNKALYRAAKWLYDVGQPATGDKEFQAWLINKRYGSSFSARSPANPGKNMGWTDWTHAR